MAVTIVNRKYNNLKVFSQLDDGDTFEYDGELYMKTCAVRNSSDTCILWNSIILTTGGFAWFGSYSKVRPVDIELTVTEEKSNGEC